MHFQIDDHNKRTFIIQGKHITNLLFGNNHFNFNRIHLYKLKSPLKSLTTNI